MEHNIKFDASNDCMFSAMGVDPNLMEDMNKKVAMICKAQIEEMIRSAEQIEESEEKTVLMGTLSKVKIAEALINCLSLEELLFIATDNIVGKIKENTGPIIEMCKQRKR
jgi:hypothetical protein